MLSSRAGVWVTWLCAAAGCGFAPSGGASSGDGDGQGAGDSGSPETVDAGDGDIGGDKTDAEASALDPCAPADGLVACYPFESNLEDGSGEENDLTGSGYTFGAGNAGSALAVDDGADMGAIDDSSLDFDQALTVEAWVAPGESQQRWFVDHDNRWGIEIEDDWTLRCTVVFPGEEADETIAVEVTGVHPGAGHWTHVACTYDGRAVALYVEGVEVDSSPASGRIDGGEGDGFTVGRDAPDGDSFIGRIDTVRIWSLARSKPQIQCSAAGEC